MTFAVSGIANLSIYLNEQKDYRVSSRDFISLAHNSLAQIDIHNNENLEKIRSDFDALARYDFAKENKFIQQLQDKNTQKFDTLLQILEAESDKNTLLQKDIHTLLYNDTFISINSTIDDDISSYKKALDPHNAAFIKAANDLVLPHDPVARDIQLSLIHI